MIYIIGIIVSLLVQWLKSAFPTGGWRTMAILLGVSVVASILYTYFVHTGMWESITQVLTTAGAFYAFVIQRFEGDSNPVSVSNIIE